MLVELSRKAGVVGLKNMRFDKFTLKVQEAIQEAQTLAGSYGHQAIEPEHLLVSFLRQEEGIVGAILNKLGATASAD